MEGRVSERSEVLGTRAGMGQAFRWVWVTVLGAVGESQT